MYFKTAILVLFIVFSIEILSQTLEGETCTISNDVQGICLNIKHCPKAIEMLKERKKPETCNFNGSDPVVCCPISNKSLEICAKYGRELRRLRVHSLVGGTDVVAQEFPHMAALGFGTKENIVWKCGGTLISDRFVLTAAHCLRDLNGEVKFVRMGSIRLNRKSVNNQDFDIVRRIPNPEYKPPLTYHDIALVELDRTPTYSFDLKPACLHTEFTVAPGVQWMLEAAGWGLTQVAGNPSEVLQKVKLDLFNNTICNLSYKKTKRRLPNGILDDRQICAGGRDKEADTCHGDSGGPLQIYRFSEKLYGIIGVTAFGKSCGTPNVPSVYNRVAYYVPWIESIVWP